MVLSGCKTLILRCCFCNRLKEYEINLFCIRGNKNIEYRCECGKVNMAMSMNKDISISIECFNCRKKYYYYLNLHTILKEHNIIYCDCGAEILFLGSSQMAKKVLLEKSINIKGTNNNDESEEYFSNFKVLAKILSIIYALKKDNKISCNCGYSYINMELFCDRIELKCLNCHSVKLIFAETEEDLSVLLKKDKIVLDKKNISCIDSIKEKNRDIKK